MTRNETCQAVVLTGYREVHSPLLNGTGLHSKVLLPIGGKPMLAHVLTALAGSRYAPALSVSSNDPQVLTFQCGIPFQTLPSEQSAVQSLTGALKRLPPSDWVLFVSGDHPLLTPEMVDYFIAETQRRELALSVAMISEACIQRDYPESRRTYFRVKGGGYTGGNLFMVNREAFCGNEAFMEAIDRNRKKPWKHLLMSDPLTIVQFLLRQLDIHELFRRGSRLLGCTAGVVEIPFAECGMDVDKPSDREIAEAILRRRAKAETPQTAGLEGTGMPTDPEVSTSAG